MYSNPLSEARLTRAHEIRGSWGWILLAGILLIMLGTVCIIGDVTATLATVFVLGLFLLFSGIVILVQAFRVRNWSGFFLYLMSGLLRALTGYLLIRYPGVGAAVLTLVLASLFVVGGLFRVIGAETLKFPRWGWSVVSGIVSVVLGILLLVQMPISAFWFVGFAIGVDMIMEGVSLVGVSTAIHHLPDMAPAGI
jgi:uncharacterized membrane protein HdeD (DUF308 family)